MTEFDKTGKENPFRVPENYFSELPGLIRKRISEETQPVLMQKTSFRRYWYAAAAVIIMVLTTIYLLQNNADNDNKFIAEFYWDDLINNGDMIDFDEGMIVNQLIGEYKQNEEIVLLSEDCFIPTGNVHENPDEVIDYILFEEETDNIF